MQRGLLRAFFVLLTLAGCGDDQSLPTPDKGARIVSFTAEPTKIKNGEAATLSWETVGTDGVNIEPTVGLQPPTGSAEVRPFAPTTYTLTVRDGDETLTAQVTVEVVGGPPRIDAFTATPRTIQLGETSVLSWETSNSSHVVIEPDVGMQPPAGTAMVMPQVTTAYRITAHGSEGGTATTEVTIVVASGNQPFIRSFTSSPSTIQEGQSATLSWETINADMVTIDNGVGPQPANGSATVSPTKTTIYNLTAVGPGGTASLPVTVTVEGTGAPVVLRFEASPATISPGGMASLTWETDNALGVTIDNGVGAQPAKGSVSVSPGQTTTYTLTALGNNGEASATATVMVAGANTPVVLTFQAQPQAVQAGGSTTLTWTTQNAMSVNIDNGVGNNLPANGSIQASPAQTTTYTLTAVGAAGMATSQITVTVGAAPPLIQSFVAQPASINAGQAATLSWSTQNTTSVSIDNGVGSNLPASGMAQVMPTSATVYILTAVGPGGQATAQVTVTVSAVGAPTVLSFTATPQQITPGAMTTLAWDTANATGVTIDNGVGPQALTGQVAVSPNVTTTYTLTADGAGGSSTAQVTVTVASDSGDKCSDPFLITSSAVFTGNTQTAVNDYEQSTSCTGYSSTGPDVVYKVPLQVGDRLQASLSPSNTTWDASLYLVTGCQDIAQSCVTGQDNGNPEQIDYTAASAGDYFLIVDGYAGAGGTYSLDVQLNPAPVPNDQCGGAIDATAGGAFSGDTRNAVNDYSPGTGGCTGYEEASKDVVYKVTLAAGERLQASLDAPWDSALYVLSDCASPTTSCVGGQDNGNPEEVDFVAQNAGTYFIIVDGYRNAVGNFTLSVSISPPVVGGETCAAPVDVPSGGGSFNSTTVGLANDYDPPLACFGSASPGPDRVYSLDAQAGDVFEVLAEVEAGHDASIYLLSAGCDPSADCLGGANAGQAGQAEGVRFVAQNQAEYFLVVDSPVASGGTHDLTIAQYHGDTCPEAAPLAYDGVAEWFTTSGLANDYSPNSGGCTGFSASAPERAYGIYLYAGEQLQVDVAPTGSWDPSIYLVSSCTDIGGSCIAGSDTPAVGGAERLNAVVQQAGVYYLIVDGFLSQDSGAGQITSQIVRGDTCETAYTIGASGGVFNGTTTGYGAELGIGSSTGSCTGWAQNGPDAVYQVTLGDGQRIQASLSASWDSALYLVSDCAQSATTCVAGQDNGNPEEIDYTNNSGGAQTYYLIVDSWLASTQGNYTLTVDVQ